MSMKVEFLQNKGVASYLTVIFMALVATLVIAVIQSRLITGIYRQRALSDTLKSSYGAESKIYDILAKVIYYGATPPSGTETLPDGTELNFIFQTISPDIQRVIVTAERPFAVNKIIADRQFNITGGVDKVEMILALDCTGSMGAKADPSCSGSDCISKMTAQKNAVKHFLQTIDAMVEKDKIYTGLAVFAGGLELGTTLNDAQWFTINGGLPTRQIATPTNDYDKLLSILETGLQTNRENSPACCFAASGFRNADCQLETRGTSVGSGYAFINDYFKNNPIPEDQVVKRFEIVVTDGLPNSRNLEYPDCPFTDFSPSPPPPPYCREPMLPPYDSYASACVKEAKNYLRCTLADQEQNIDEFPASLQPFSGLRDVENSAYGVVVYGGVPNDVREIFLKYAGPENQNYFETENANNLTNILEDILSDIIETTLKITIKREAP